MSYNWKTYRSAGHHLLESAVQIGEQLAKAADRFLKPYRLTLAQFNLLAVLAGEAEGIPQSRIGSRLTVSRANITGLVRRMKARGLCRTVSDPDDSRVKLVRITPAGEKLIQKIEAPYFREIGRLTKSIRESDMKRAVETLLRISGSVRQSPQDKQ